MRRGGMHPDDLMKPDLLSEILLLASGMSDASSFGACISHQDAHVAPRGCALPLNFLVIPSPLN
jgi:hypothetical protein